MLTHTSLQILQILFVSLSVFLFLLSGLVVVIFVVLLLLLLLLILPPADADMCLALQAPPTDVDSELRSVFSLLWRCLLQTLPRETYRMDGLESRYLPSGDVRRYDLQDPW